MQRTQIYIEEKQLDQLKVEAEKKNMKSVSKLIRDAIDLFLQSQTTQLNWEKDSLTKMIGKVKLNKTDAARNHDRYLYK